MESAGGEALEAADALQEEVSGLTARTADGAVSSAREKVARVRRAFFQAESALFYTDAGSPEELAALPDPRQPVSADPPGLAETETLLDTYASLPVNPYVLPRSRLHADEVAANLSSQAAATESALTPLAEAWNPENPENFRHRFFLAEPDDAIARIFQGAISVSAALLAAPSAEHSESALREIRLNRLKGIRNILDGAYDSETGDPVLGAGLKLLIRERDPAAAGALDEALSRSLRAVETSAAEADTLQPSLRDLHRRLIEAAAALGLEVEEE